MGATLKLNFVLNIQVENIPDTSVFYFSRAGAYSRGSMARIQALDARQKPPESIKASYKLYQKLSLEAISTDPGIIDFSRGLSIEQAQKCKQVSKISYDSVRLACHRFRHTGNEEPWPPREIAVFEHEDIPGEAMEALAV